MIWTDYARRVTPYVPGEQPAGKDIIKLNTNECPYPPSPMAAKALEELEDGELRLYPDPECAVLRDAVAGYYGLRRDQVFAGVGSDDVLAMCFLSFFRSGMPVLFPDVTYSFYDVWAELFGIPYEPIPLDRELRIRPKDYCRPNGGIVFPNPNAPTGILQPLCSVEEILAGSRESVVIVDEAYIDFGGESAVSLLDRYDNLLVVQTFSKSRAMAGLRIGYALGNQRMIQFLTNVKFSFNSYTMSRPALMAGAAAMADREYFEEITGRIVRTRERIRPVLEQMGFFVTDSMANFLFVSHRDKKAEDIFEYLKSKKIYVRYFRKPRIDNYLRITVGTDEEMDLLTDCLREYLG